MCSGRLSLYTEMRQGTLLRLPQVREGLPRWRMRAVSPVRHANLPGTTQRRSSDRACCSCAHEAHRLTCCYAAAQCGKQASSLPCTARVPSCGDTCEKVTPELHFSFGSPAVRSRNQQLANLPIRRPLHAASIGAWRGVMRASVRRAGSSWYVCVLDRWCGVCPVSTSSSVLTASPRT